MAWVTSGTDVACSLTVQKVLLGQVVSGYPKTYSILDAFDDYPSITLNEWHKMAQDPRNERIAAFKLYVGQIEDVSVDDTQTNDVYRPSEEVPGQVVEE